MFLHGAQQMFDVVVRIVNMETRTHSGKFRYLVLDRTNDDMFVAREPFR